MPKAGMLVAASGVEDAGRWAREILAHARRAEGEARVLSRTAGEEPDFVAGEVGSQAVIGLKGQGSLWSGCWAQGTIAVAMEGGLTNRARLRGAFLDEGGFLSSVEAAELILALLSRSDQKTFINRLLDAARQLEGGFALVAMDREKLVGIRDPWGLRSLSVGRVGSGYALATESSAFEPGAFIRELAPGELLIVEEGRLEAIRPFPRRPKKFCTLELSSLSNPATSYGEREAHAARIRLGEILARQAPAWGDLVVGVLGVAEAQATGFGRRTAIPVEPILGPGGAVVRSVVAGRRIVLVDADLSAGKQVRSLIRNLKNAGATEVHLRIASPVVVAGCLYGVDFAEEPLAPEGQLGELANYLECSSFGALDIAGLQEALGEEIWCNACFTREPPLVSSSPEAGQLALFGGSRA